MPELIEVETYRRQAESLVGRAVADVVAPDGWYLKDTSAEELVQVVVGQTVEAARRIGKLLVLDLSDGARLGLRFGMTGRLVIDGDVAIDRLLYSSARREPSWDRFGLRFRPDGDLVMRDPRRLGGVSLDPDEDRLGVDALQLTPDDLAKALLRGPAQRRGRGPSGPAPKAPRAGSNAGGPAAKPPRPAAPRRDSPADSPSQVALKARLMDQSRVAGLGNLLTDEILWRAGLDPARPAASLSSEEVDTLSATIRSTLKELTERGGSHTGDLQPARVPGGLCPADGTPLQRRNIGGRTTISCPRHQR